MSTLLTGSYLSLDQQDADASLGTWIAASPNTTLTRDTAVFASGPASFKLTAIAAGNVSMKTGYNIAISAGATAHFSFKVRQGATKRTCSGVVNWTDTPKVTLLRQDFPTFDFSHATDTFSKTTTVSYVAPTSAAFAELAIEVSGLSAGESVYVDQINFASANNLEALNDSFSRTSATTLGVTPDGRAWTAHIGTWGTNGTQAYSVTAVDNDQATVDTGEVNMDVSWPVQVIVGGNHAVLLAWVDTTNHFLVHVEPTGVTKLQRRDAGVNTDLLNVSGTVDGDVLRARRTNANQWTLYRNGVQIGQTDTAQTQHATATRAGLRQGGTGVAMRWDYFTAGSAIKANAGLDQTVPASAVVTLVGTPAGGVWTQDSGTVVSLSAPVTNATDTRVTFVATNASTSVNNVRVFRYTVGEETITSTVYTQGFEDTTLAGWARSSTSSGTATATVTNSPNFAKSGSLSLRSELSGSGTYLLRGPNFTTVPNTTYKLSVWTYGTSTNTRSVYFNWRRTDGTSIADSETETITPVANKWIEQVVTVTSPADATQAAIYVRVNDIANGYNIYLDDINVVASNSTDSFTRAASTTSLGSHPNGKPYVVLGGTWGVTSDGKAYCVTANDSDLVTLDAGGNNWDISANLETAANGYTGLVAGVVDGSNHYLVEPNGSNGVISLHRRNPSGGGSPVLFTSASNLFVSGDKLGLKRTNGNQLTVFHNDVEIFQTGTAETFLLNSKVGFRHGSVASNLPLRWDNFKVTSAIEPIVDNFDRTDTVNGLTQTASGITYVRSQDSVWGIIGNRAYASTHHADGGAQLVVDSGKVNHKVSARIYGVRGVAAQYGNVVASFVDRINFVWLEVNETGDLRINKKVAATNTTISPVVIQAVVEGDELTLERVNGNQYIGYVNGVERCRSDATQTILETATLAGIGSGKYGTGNITFDNLRVE